MTSTSLTAGFLNRQTSAIIGAAIEIHRALGPGLLENAYLPCLVYELRCAGLVVETSVRLPLIYKDVRISTAYVADAVIGRAVLVEVKAMEAIAAIHKRQLSTYLRLGDFPVGLLLNFGALTMAQGIHRSANHFPDA